MFFQRRLDVVRSNCELSLARSREHERLLRIEPVMNDLGFDRIGVGREGRLFHQDLETRFRGPIKRGHHQMKIHRQAVHADDFVRFRADEPRHRLAQRLVIRVPRRRRAEMRIDRELRPIVQLLFDDFPRRFRHQAERIPGEVNERLAVLAEWQMKFLSELTKRILGIEFLRKLFVSGERHGHFSRQD